MCGRMTSGDLSHSLTLYPKMNDAIIYECELVMVVKYLTTQYDSEYV